MRPAVLRQLRVDGGVAIEVQIREFGKYLVPRDVLGPDLYGTALEVLSISVSSDSQYLVIEALNGTITTEWIAPRVRLSIRPAFNDQDIGILMDLAGGRTNALSAVEMPLPLRAGAGFLDFLGNRLLAEVETLLISGLAASMRSDIVVSPALRGTVVATDSVRRIFYRQQVEFVQIRRGATHDIPLNRVLRSALDCVLHKAEADLRGRAANLLQHFHEVEPFRSQAEAVACCRSLLSVNDFDAARPGYRTTIAAALPILEAVSGAYGGIDVVGAPAVRLRMPDVFERAVRNTVEYALGTRYHVRKASGFRLYRTPEPKEYGPAVEPDVLVSPIERCNVIVAVLDAKYKPAAAAGDHYQMAAYAAVLRPQICALVTLTEEDQVAGVRGAVQLGEKSQLFEYALQPSALGASLRSFVSWLRQLIGASDGETRYRFYWSSAAADLGRLR